MQYITLLDYFLLPFYIVIIYTLAYKFRAEHYPYGHPWRPYFIPALTVKIFGAVAISLLYVFYYGGGDTLEYYRQAKVVNSAFSESVSKWFGLIFHIPDWYDGSYTLYTSQMNWYAHATEFTVVQITAFILILTFNSYLPASVVLGALSFTGVWALFRTFADQYPKLSKPLAICMLFIPSTVMWGSGIFKDTICMFGIGWLTISVFRTITLRQFKPLYIILGLFSFILIARIKMYILMAFIPSLSLWIVFNYIHKIKMKSVRFLIKIAMVGAMAVGFIALGNKLSESLGKYSLANVASTVITTRDWINMSSADASITYDLGPFDPSLSGMLKKFPGAVNVTLFRPYIWETKKIIQFISAFEATLIFLLSLKVVLALGIKKTWKAITEDTNIQFCLIFTLIFAFAVGISSFNFGTLSRYRIPCLPFYMAALVLIYYKYNPPHKRFISFRL
jgi:hypothetical protein